MLERLISDGVEDAILQSWLDGQGGTGDLTENGVRNWMRSRIRVEKASRQGDL